MSNLGKEKSKAEQLQEELFLKPKHAMRGGLADAEIERADQFCEDYKVFLNSAKTEREAAGFSAARQRRWASLPLIRKRNTTRAIKFTA